MRSVRRAAACALVATLAAGCTPPPGGPAPPATPIAGPTSPTAAAPSASPTPAEVDLTVPGAAQEMIARLMTASGATRALMVTVTRRDASVSVVTGGAAVTWAWRDGRVQQVQSDINYVAQRTFSPSEFDLGDVGALFRAARAVSGSQEGQSLQIVDYSGGLVTLSVSTNPESRTVFFNRDGTLLPTLDFTSAWGLGQAYEDVVGARGTASAVAFGSALGAYLDSPMDAQGAFQRRQRSARTPVIVTPRTETARRPAFDPSRVRPSVVWGVLEAQRAQGRFALDQAWSCIVDDRAGTGTPRMYFTVADREFTTDLAGSPLR